MQSEFIVLDKVGDEDEWVHNFLEIFHVIQNQC